MTKTYAKGKVFFIKMFEGYSDLEDRSTRPCGPGLGRRLLEHSRDRRHRRWSCRDLPMQR